MRSSISQRNLLLILLLCYIPLSFALPSDISGGWYQATETDWQYSQQAILNKADISPVSNISLTGGEYWFQGQFTITQPDHYVLDFQNSTTIGRFTHYLFNSANQLIATRHGGIQDNEIENPFFLRHGREIELAAGEYRLITQMSSPFYLAQPRPFISDRYSYRQAIKGGNALVMSGLGLFLGLGLYYLVLSLYRQRRTELMYAIFILGNFLYNSTALLVLPDLIDLHWIYLISTPILFSNAAYIVFVMLLLGINAKTHPRLYQGGIFSLGLISLFAITAFMLPNWSLEMARAGVAVFLLYGLFAGFTRNKQGNKTARRYLIAVGIFVIVGGSAISKSTLPGIYTYHVEHIGLLAVMLEVLLLSFVVSYQLRKLEDEKATLLTNYTAAQHRSDELAAAIAEAERANKAKSDFLSNMSHELRTPLNAILGYADLMLEEGELPKEHVKDINRIHQAGSHLLELINGILDLSKVEADSMEFSRSEIETNSLIEDCLTLIQPLTVEKNIRISCNSDDNYILQADAVRLKQVIINLLSNAIKYNNPNGEVHIGLHETNNNRLKISITDTGPGIEASQLNAVFKPFNRLGAEKGCIEGTGIGLSLSRSLIEHMNGKIGVESSVGKGSCFWIEAPLATSSTND